MSASDPARRAGLESVLPLLGEIWEDIRVGAVHTLLGAAALAGSSRPLPSSAAELHAGGQSIWLPAPSVPPQPERGLAPLYLHAGHTFVLPTVRLCLPAAGDENALTVEYLTLADWLHDALTRWRFAPSRAAEGQQPATLIEALTASRAAPGPGLRAVAQLIRYALFGADRRSTVAGLRFPACPMWLRPVEGTGLAERAARALVLSARLTESSDAPALPSTDLRAHRYRIQPAEPRDWGLDPVHTPEGSDIRLTARLGEGVALHGRKLHAPTERVPLSPSTARLPFAGYDDPRRLLMAANMQTHAVPLVASEAPLVRAGPDGDEPSGVNLCVGYLAWQGWNHEDAWVLSESAAAKLIAVQDEVQTVAIRAVEMPARLLVTVGQSVRRGELLVRRVLAPALLCHALDLLAGLPSLDSMVPLQPEPEDVARIDGEVLRIDEWDLLSGQNVPKDYVIPDTLVGSYRTVYRVHLRRTLPLAVGDKLANRHGHKGVVGAILPDPQMPRWRGRPLDALIEPISVLNRSNWGQVYEALAGAVARESGSPLDANSVSGAEVLERARALGADAQGRWLVEPPQHPEWLGEARPAVVGVQFVLRMPHHARDKISGSPLPGTGAAATLRRRPQRFGEMDQWALWAHGLTVPAAPGGRLTSAAARLARLLAAAGFAAAPEGGHLRIRRLALDSAPPSDAVPFPLHTGTLANAYDALECVGREGLTVFVFDPPVADVPLPEKEDTEEAPQGATRRKVAMRWLPVLPACDRPDRRLRDDSEEPHELTRSLRRILRAARVRAAALQREASPDQADAVAKAEADLRYALRDLLEEAHALAIGVRATGLFSSKLSFLRRVVLGRRLGRSGRSTASPGGTLGLGLDEIGVPPALARVLFGPALPDDDAELTAAVRGRWIWLKRDPVLHRWGLLPVQIRVVPGATIRLPASLLGPLGADFDGDTVAIFAALPGVCGDAPACRPSALAWHPLFHREMFFPGKQYNYGLHLLAEHADRLAAFQEALAAAGAPAWPQGLKVKAAATAWVEQTKNKAADGHWWAILEKHALRTLAVQPDMQFGLLGVDELAALPAVACGAAKNLYEGDKAREAMTQILAGKSLDIYRRRADATPRQADPIADVMVAAKVAIGRFGGALRRLVYTAQPLRPEHVQQAQGLTEQVTQKALSVKAGKPPIQYGEYEGQLRRLLRGEAWKVVAGSELAEILKPMEGVWGSLRAVMPPEPTAWLEWLRKPHELATLLRRSPDGALRLPLDDLRLACWLADGGTDSGEDAAD